MVDDKWISGAIRHPGSLHKSLHVPHGDTIPQGKLNNASHSENPSLAKKANLAKTLEKFRSRHGKDA